MHRGMDSELIDIAKPEIRTGEDGDGSYAEVVVPDEFAPGSIMVFATDMEVSWVVWGWESGMGRRAVGLVKEG